jgi:multiple sugar transport system permease protein
MTSRKSHATLILLLTLGAVVSVFPAFWMFYTSFCPAEKLSAVPPVFVHSEFTLLNYTQLLLNAPVARWTVNSFVICAAITLGQLLFDSMAGYAFARKKFFGRQILFWLVVGTMMVPVQILIVPLYSPGWPARSEFSS